jgi:hypothetical protein
MYLNKKIFNMNLIKKKFFILFCYGIFFAKLSIKSSIAPENNYFTGRKSSELNQHPFIERLQKLSKDNPSMFSFLGGLGAHYIFKKAANNIYKQIALPVVTWSLGHTIFLLVINEDKKNISSIFSPFPPKKLKTRKNGLKQEFNCFPFINFAKKIIFENQETIKNNILNALDKAKKNSLLAPWAIFGFGSPILYKKLKSYFIKKILWYVLIQESLTLGAFLTNQENRNIDAMKEYLLDHKSPKSEINFYESPIKIYPVLNLGLDFINTLFPKQDIINKFLAQPFIKELKDSSQEVTEEMLKQLYKNPTRQSLETIKKEILRINQSSPI